MSWSEMPCLAFDIESDSPDPTEAHIVTAAAVKLAPGVADPRVTTWYANQGPDFVMPEEATAVNGITTEMARAHPTPIDQALFEMTGLIAWALGRGIPVVVFNSPYDLTLLEAENRRHGIPTLVDRLGSRGIGPIIDPLILDARTFRKMTKRPTEENPKAKVCPCGCGAVDKTLVGACLHYGIPLPDAHEASADALAAGLLWGQILDRNPGRFRQFRTLAALHQAQIGWQVERMESLEKFHIAEGTVDGEYNRGWPVQTPPRAPVTPPVKVEGALL